VNCGLCSEWAHFGCDRRQGLGTFKVKLVGPLTHTIPAEEVKPAFDYEHEGVTLNSSSHTFLFQIQRRSTHTSLSFFSYDNSQVSA
jgi:hypothetical protein